MTEPSALHHPLAPTAPVEPVEPAEPIELELIELARRQAQLVAALVGCAEPPAGCTAAALASTALTLIRKRWAAVGRHYPVLTGALTEPIAASGQPAGEQAGAEAFTAWAQAHRAAGGLPAGGPGDGLLFAAHLAARGELPAVAVAEVGSARAGARVDGPAIGGRCGLAGGGAPP